MKTLMKVLNGATPIDSVELLWAWLRNGWAYRLPHNSFLAEHAEECGARVQYEMSVILGKGFPDYFLVTSDLVRFAKDSGIAVGPGRGSAAASLVCFLLRITEINPLEHPNMLFERFIDPTRDDMPDIDLDFEDERRHEVQEYAVRKYGADCVGNVANFMRFRGKTAVNDVARVNKVPKWAAESVNNLIIDRSAGDPHQNDSIRDTFILFPRAAEILKQFPALSLAADLEGNYRGMGMHAAGLVISSRPITDTCALYTREIGVGKKKKKVTVISADKKSAEYLGMLKVDLLGLSTMGMIARALRLIDMPLAELYRVPLDDQRTLDAFREGDLTGTFQFEGRTQRGVTHAVKPTTLAHLIDISALARPGPLGSGAYDAYVRRRHGEAVPSIHPVVDELVANSYGTHIYQEQVLLTLARVGGFPPGRIGDIRRIIGQKLGEAAFDAAYEEFEQGARDQHGIDPELARSIWNRMVTSSKYLFNYAHSCSYSILAFWCMWLKVHHPLAFFAAQLSKAGKEKLPRLLQDALNHGIEILPPHPALSNLTWEPEEQIQPEAPPTLRAGLLQIPGVGEATAIPMIEYRAADGIRITWDHYTAIKGIGPKTVESMRGFAEAEDPFGLQRVRTVLREYRQGIREGRPDFHGLPLPTHTSDSIPETGTHTVVWMGFVKKVKYQNEIEKIRARTNQDEAEILSTLRDPHLLDSAVLVCYDDGDEDVYVRINRWAFPVLRDSIDCIIPDADVVVVTGTKKDGGGFGISLFANRIEVLEQDEPEPADQEI
jgi:DNA polymerase-3 subunit alpha